MKKKIIFWGILIVCLVVAATAVLCRRNFFPSPEEVTKMKLDQLFQGNGKKSGKADADVAALFMAKIQETQLACALDEPENHQDKFFENIRMGLQKFDYEVSEISVSDDKAEVSVSINYFKLQGIAQNAQNALQDYLRENDSLSTKEMIEKLYEIIAGEFQKGPSDNSKTRVTILLHKKNHRWKMDDAFDDEILDAVLQQ